MDCQQRTEYGNQVLFRFGQVHGVLEAAESKIKEFLHHLVANHSVPSICRLPDQLPARRALAGDLASKA